MPQVIELSPEARAKAIIRMAVTLARKPRKKKTRDYVASLSGAQMPADAPASYSTPEQPVFKWVTRNSAKHAVREASQAPFTPRLEQDGVPEKPRIRKDRVRPHARHSDLPKGAIVTDFPKAVVANMRNPEKHCRMRSRFHRGRQADSPRVARDMTEAYAVRNALIEAQGRICAICGKPLPTVNHRSSIDHVIPRALGGRDAVGNFVAAHNLCNSGKSNDAPTGCEMIWLLAVNARIGAMPVVY